MKDTQICCFTGHREIARDRISHITSKLDTVIKGLIQKGVTRFRSGGARGFDTLAALAVIKQKREFKHIHLELVIPCINQTGGWSEEEIAKYHYILNHSDKVHTQISKEQAPGEFNQKLVDGSDFCVAFMERDTGYTVRTVDYAKSKQIMIYNISE
ncbi:MAG: hypothetical protein BGN88_11230 [Clostridiales bacterium 43-6]|nr:MAG: hypothetical protein BGN88_11230 [Clostridiales bacterium 43-6]